MNFLFDTMLGISGLAGEILASQEALRSMELCICLVG